METEIWVLRLWIVSGSGRGAVIDCCVCVNYSSGSVIGRFFLKLSAKRL